MKFEQAFDMAFDEAKKRAEAKGEIFAVEPKSAKIMAFIWNIMASAQGNFEDFAYINKENEIVSIPIDRKPKGAQKKPSENEGIDGSESS